MDVIFDDGLSEDWISQPRSSEAPSIKDDSFISRQTTKTPHSRIPRPKRASELTSKSSRQHLPNLGQENGLMSSRKPSRRFSSQSMVSIAVGTVQQRQGKDAQDIESGTLPEWKKRLLHNGKRTGGQLDLFSPIGLETAFQPPDGRSPPPRKLQRPRSKQTEEHFPSSPPVYRARDVITSVAESKNQESSLDLNSVPATENLEPPVTAYRWDPDDTEDLDLPPVLQDEAGEDNKPENDSEGQDSKKSKASDSFAQSLQSRLESLDIEDEQPLPLLDDDDDDNDAPDLPKSENSTTHHSMAQPLRKNYDVERDNAIYDDETPLLANSAFVTIERGGHSEDDSFLRKSLSAPSYGDSFVPTAPEPPFVDLAKLPDLLNDRPSTPERPNLNRASDSPLKLFDKYDTYTNAFLNRRVTQFEERSPASTAAGTADPRKLRSSPPPQLLRKTRGRNMNNENRRMSNFGGGQLDSFGFDHRYPSKVPISSPSLNDEDQENQPPLPQLDRNSHTKFRSQGHSRPALTERRVNVNRASGGNVQSQDLDKGEPSKSHRPTFNEEGKRIPSSPQKKRESKRRRTSEVIVGGSLTAEFEETKQSAPPASIVAGKKRKDARYEKSNQIADPDIIATRHRLQPRASNVSSRATSYVRKTSDPSGSVNSVSGRRADISTEALADQLASFAHVVAESVVHGTRKKSVTTADYFKEANIIMQNIRARAQPNTDLATDQITEQDKLSNVEESFYDEYTMDDFSRPASREGSRPRNRNPIRQMSARVVSHLKKFGEADEGDEFGPEFDIREDSSLRDHGDYENESDPPNVRIHERRNQLPLDESDSSRNTSNKSTGETTGRSVPTASSSSTGRPKVILPDTVSHLIGKTIGKMTFDSKLQRWVKRKPSEKSAEPDALDSEMTEDDPFKEIPDLAVDESQELRHIRTNSNATRPWSQESDGVAATADDNITQQSRPKSSGTTEGLDAESSSFTKISRFASSGPVAETRATSWGDQPTTNREPRLPKPTSHLFNSQAPIEENSLVLLNTEERTRIQSPVDELSQYKAQSVMIGPSSHRPKSSGGPDKLAENDDVWEDESVLDLSEPVNNTNEPKFYSESGRQKMFQHGSTRQARQFSIGNRVFVPRPISRIDEHDELSLMRLNSGDQSHMQLALSTPQPLRDVPGTLSMPPTGNRNSSVGFHLSPLPDFTINADESMSLDVDYVAKRRGLLSLQDVENKFSLAIKDLVQRITDVEPYEPYWEYIRKLELRDRKLITLHMLDELCQRIEELDVSDNELGQINGAPATLRALNISGNCLSGLTSWAHLNNLQYVNVAGNNIDSLKGFSTLIHLRELNAENNNLNSLEGILSLDGLLRLNVGRNSLERLDFVNADLHRLVELHAFENSISSIQGLQGLTSIGKLDLRDNRLSSFSITLESIPKALKILDLSKNDLSELNVTEAPWINRLVVDSNHIMAIEGLERLRKLQHLSWRNQTPSSVKSPTLRYDNCVEAQVLSLSGNKFSTLNLNTFFLNLRRLELASCGLDMLDEHFGQKMPNLRFLNLNYNGIRDLAPLLGIANLEELHVVGNRVTRLRRTTTIFGTFKNSLRVIDCRTNPLTLGFYSPKTEKRDTDADLARARPGEWTSCPAPTDVTMIAELSYLVPSAPGDANEEYEKRLDEETKFRRQVYELLVLEGCKNLEVLDGRSTDKMKVKDRKATKKRLIELGVIKRKTGRS